MTEKDDKETKEKINNSLVNRMLEGKWDEVRSLINEGADPNHQFTFGKATVTVLMQAIDASAFDIATLLVEKGADPNQPGYSGMRNRVTTPLKIATYIEYSTDTDILIRALVKHGANINEKSKELDFTALSHAVLHGKDETVDLLLELGAKLKVGTNGEANAIGVAKEQEDVEMVAKLENVKLQRAAAKVESVDHSVKLPRKKVRL